MAERRVQRRLAAILAADVVGYSRLMEVDEVGTMAALKARRSDVLGPLVAKHQGRIFKTNGDGVLVEFASAVNAVQCAIDLQHGMAAANGGLSEDRRIVLRIGVNLGDIVVEGGDLYGDGANIAARLEALAEPGGILISGTAHDHIRNKVMVGVDDLGAQTLKNIVEPVRAYRVAGTPAVAVAELKPATSKPSIAVLPFTNMSGDREQDYFSDGITEDIITELSRFRSLSVIARNSSFQFRDKAVDIRRVGRELGVQYLVEGSIRRSGENLRVTAQLIEAETGNHIWAERYDRELVDIFAVQDEVTSSIVGTLAIQLEDASLERARQKLPENVRAYEHWLRGKRLVFLMGERNQEARQDFERAATSDPNFSGAYSGLALTCQMECLDFPLPEVARVAWEKSLLFAQRAVVLDDANHQAHSALAYAQLYRRDYDQVRKHMERAIKLYPSDADTLAHAAYIFAILGDLEKGIKYGRDALRLNPLHPDWYLVMLSTPLFLTQHYEEALALHVQAADPFVDSPFETAAILAQMGRLDEAKGWADKAVSRLAATPGGALAVAEGRVIQLWLENNPYRRQEDCDHLAKGMRKAGVPG